MTEKFYIVKDSSIREDAQERTHVILIDGTFKEIKFKFGEDTVLPEREAMKFLLDGFTVIGTDNVPFTNPENPPIGSPIVLKSDEVVAKYSELMTESLVIRAAVKPNGEQFLGDDVSREALIAFLSGVSLEPEVHEELEIEEDDDDALLKEEVELNLVEGQTDGEENAEDSDNETEQQEPEPEDSNEVSTDNAALQEQTSDENGFNSENIEEKEPLEDVSEDTQEEKE